MKRLSFVFLICILILSGCTSSKTVEDTTLTDGKLNTTAVSNVANSIIENTTKKDNETEKAEVVDLVDDKTVYFAEIDVEDYGVIKVKLNQKEAPITVNNFITLANDGFYDGLTFHRIMEGFMIQGGDPQGTGLGGSDKNIIGEFSANGVENNISHVRGVISMARQGENPYTGEKNYDTASSQFFIVHEDSLFLDGQYAGFGEVIKGMEIVDSICEKAHPVDDNGTIIPEEQPIINTIKIIAEE